MLLYVYFASGLLATVYGFGEKYCGNPGHAIPCQDGALTASGEPLDSSEPQAAVPMPEGMLVAPRWIFLRMKDGPCVPIKIVDKKHWRYIKKGGFDLTKKAVALLTGHRAVRTWSGKVYTCKRSMVDPLVFRYWVLGQDSSPAI